MMMKVKPFSYHIPPRRRAYDSNTKCGPATQSTITTAYSSYRISSTSSINNIRHREDISATISHPSYFTSSSLFPFGGVGTVLILVLLGFIGVAGQGKLGAMRHSDSVIFPTQGLLRDPEQQRFSYQSVDSNIGMTSEENGDDDDDTLQQRISSMGHYGAKYRNASYLYNYSSYPPQPHHYYKGQYKLDSNAFATLRNTPRENKLMSLHEDNPHFHQTSTAKNNSDGERNSLQTNPDFRGDSKGREGNQVVFHEGDRNSFPMISEPPTPNRTSSMSGRQNQYLNSKHRHYQLEERPDLSATKSMRQYNRENINEWEEGSVAIGDEENNIEKSRKPAFSVSSGERGRPFRTPDLDDYDDEDALDRFIPGNSSHTSGKLRFKQNSQAEVDGVDDENSLRSRRRPRRSVVHLYDMVVCSTGCNPLIFKGYGCYCGFLGSGLTVDGIDNCCAKHDWCYHHAKCPPLLTYFVPYYWRCDHGRPQCVTDFRGWKGVCGAHLCECDRQFAECLKKFPCPRSRAMCVTSPWSNQMPADPRALPFTVSRRPRPWRPPPLPPLPPPGIPLLTFPPIMGRLFP